MEQDVEDELNVVRSIYCNSELEVKSKSKPVINIQQTKDDASKLAVKNVCSDFKQHAGTLTGTAMLLDLLSWLEEKCRSIGTCETGESSSTTGKVSANLCRCVLSFDHMRDKVGYAKKLRRMTEDQRVNGLLIFYGKWIYLILEGECERLKNYKKSIRTLTMDVNSLNKKCKERMLTELSFDTIERPVFKDSFRHLQFNTPEEFASYLDCAALSELTLTLCIK